MAEISSPALDSRVKAIDANLTAMGRLAANYVDQDSTHNRTQETDETALRILQYHASEIWTHVQAAPDLASRLERSVCVLLYRLALGHRVHLYMSSQGEPVPRKSSTQDLRAKPRPERVMIEGAGLRPVEATERQGDDEIYDIPHPIAASISSMESDGDPELSELLGSVSVADLVPGSLDELCVRLAAATPLNAPVLKQIKRPPSVLGLDLEPLDDADAQLSGTLHGAPAGDELHESSEHTSYTTFLARVPMRSPSLPSTCGGVRTHSSRSLRMNPLDRSGR
ncbi:hypothetical protein AURDEDRAFT_175762 [Auricularia subglabra TFB-10046 SS5]|uniref:Uncharacterized protein n=1 Tax=Auricularia subglabra (strain TFB-10046 / SS5) TaxID=717982 RepID=J0CX00_AURST|nr:hypothetical protein AURDEDRAFT_175762 [Auricularia subglabra TFB-10046 SS5]